MKLALLMAAALSAAPVTAQAPVIPSPMDVRAIRPIICGDGGGTAFWIDRDRIITAAHVSDNGACSSGGVPLEVVRVDRDLDFTELRGLPSDVWLAYSCAEPRTGDTFYATGYPNGVLHTGAYVATDLGEREVSERVHENAFRVFIGRAWGGMSGSPNGDGDGVVHGILNAGAVPELPVPPTMLSRSLSETWICQ